MQSMENRLSHFTRRRSCEDKATGEITEKSKIVPMLTPGAIVSLSRNDVDYVTEYGAVQLEGTPVRERVKLLISIAHPKFRDELMREAGKINDLVMLTISVKLKFIKRYRLL